MKDERKKKVPCFRFRQTSTSTLYGFLYFRQMPLSERKREGREQEFKQISFTLGFIYNFFPSFAIHFSSVIFFFFPTFPLPFSLRSVDNVKNCRFYVIRCTNTALLYHEVTTHYIERFQLEKACGANEQP